MKKILITGANSYIGTSFENYLKQWPDKYQVDTVDMIDGSWKEKSFSGYDVVFHVAGIAHIKESEENAQLYYEVNRDLAIEAAAKAKTDGVKQFIFLSSMSVYGMDTGVITTDTIPKPKSHYGLSKLQAEEGIVKLQDSNFLVAILRPPMIYGKGCKGNFQSLVQIAKKLPVFPCIKNERSMLYIENLSAFLKMVITHFLSGLLFPQNREFVRTDKMIEIIGNQLGKKIRISKVLALPATVATRFITKARKAFGSLIYKDVPDFGYEYCIYEFDESVRRSV
jgi:nucleoside-diphosphate-sugar epimerase